MFRIGFKIIVGPIVGLSSTLVFFLLYAAAAGAVWVYPGEHYDVGENDQQTSRQALFGLAMVSSVNFPFPFKLIPPWVPRFGWHPTLCFVRQVKDVEIHPIHWHGSIQPITAHPNIQRRKFEYSSCYILA